MCLFDGDFSAMNGFTAEEADFAIRKRNNAIAGGMDAKVAANKGAIARALG